MPILKLSPGDLCWTPFEPHGLVKVLEIEGNHPVVPKRTVRVQFQHDHVGHAALTKGRYFLDELIPISRGGSHAPALLTRTSGAPPVRETRDAVKCGSDDAIGALQGLITLLAGGEDEPVA